MYKQLLIIISCLFSYSLESMQKAITFQDCTSEAHRYNPTTQENESLDHVDLQFKGIMPLLCYAPTHDPNFFIAPIEVMGADDADTAPNDLYQVVKRQPNGLYHYGSKVSRDKYPGVESKFIPTVLYLRRTT